MVNALQMPCYIRLSRVQLPYQQKQLQGFQGLSQWLFKISQPQKLKQ
jgi:hypothetical protein